MIMIFIKRIILSLPKRLLMYLILGYLGVEKDFPEQLSSIPYRKKRNHELSQEEKDYNTIHSKNENNGGTYYLQIEKIQDNE